MSRPATIVIDTHALISAGLLPESKTAQALALAAEHCVIAQNQATWHELETRIARPKFDRYFREDGRLRHLIKIAQPIERCEIKSDIKASRAVTDDKFIGLAIDAGASILVFGDPDLKDVQVYMGIEIVSPAQFVERFSGR